MTAAAACLRRALCAAVVLARSAGGFVLDGPRSRAKADLLGRIAAGAAEARVLDAVRAAERLALWPSLDDPRLPGNWLMVWTTSDGIAGKTRPGVFQTPAPPEQLLDLANGRAVNAERVWGVRNAVEATLTPRTRNAVRVDFRKFSVGPASFAPKDPARFRGELSVTYLDEEMRISRGDQGNVFVLLRETTQRKEADEVWRRWRKSWR